MKVSQELKDALKELPHAELLKLIHKLLPKDQVLLERLEYELTLDADERDVFRANERERIISSISGGILNYSKSFEFNPSDIYLKVREYGGMIRKYHQLFKNQEEQLSLYLYLLKSILVRFHLDIEEGGKMLSAKLVDDIYKRIIMINKLMIKVHEDIWLEFEDEILEINTILKNNAVFKSEAANKEDFESYIIGE